MADFRSSLGGLRYTAMSEERRRDECSRAAGQHAFRNQTCCADMWVVINIIIFNLEPLASRGVTMSVLLDWAG